MKNEDIQEIKIGSRVKVKPEALCPLWTDERGTVDKIDDSRVKPIQVRLDNRIELFGFDREELEVIR